MGTGWPVPAGRLGAGHEGAAYLSSGRDEGPALQQGERGDGRDTCAHTQCQGRGGRGQASPTSAVNRVLRHVGDVVCRVLSKRSEMSMSPAAGERSRSLLGTSARASGMASSRRLMK